ncbi:MAG: hypothetical protein ACOYJ1_05830 [Peptococcales bacterium]
MESIKNMFINAVLRITMFLIAGTFFYFYRNSIGGIKIIFFILWTFFALQTFYIVDKEKSRYFWIVMLYALGITFEITAILNFYFKIKYYGDYNFMINLIQIIIGIAIFAGSYSWHKKISKKEAKNENPNLRQPALDELPDDIEHNEKVNS